MEDDWPNSHWSQPNSPNASPPSIGGIVFMILGLSLMGPLMLFIGFVNDDGEALFWGGCLTIPFLIATLLAVSKTMRKISSAIASNSPMSREALFREPSVAPSMNPLPVQMAGRGSRLDRYQSVMFRLRLAPSEGQTVTSLIAQHKRWFNGGEKAARAFFNHPQVVKALDLRGTNPTSSGQTKASSTTQNAGKLTANLVNDSFWGNLDQKAAKSVPAADGVCGMARCSNEVNAFSFQCFNCRRRICSSCGNNGVLCRTCAS
jgi:hypothetical protein